MDDRMFSRKCDAAMDKDKYRMRYYAWTIWNGIRKYGPGFDLRLCKMYLSVEGLACVFASFARDVPARTENWIKHLTYFEQVDVLGDCRTNANSCKATAETSTGRLTDRFFQLRLEPLATPTERANVKRGAQMLPQCKFIFIIKYRSFDISHSLFI